MTSSPPKTLAAAALAALVALGLLFVLSPVGASSAQEDETSEAPPTEDTDDPETDDTDTDDDPDADDDGERGWDHEERREEMAARAEELLQLFADELGVSVEDVQDATRAVVESVIDERVADGDLTQEQADELLEAYDERAADGIGGLLPGPGGLHGFGGPGGPFGDGRGFDGPRGFGHHD